MRQKFEAEDPAEVSKAGNDKVDRSQGAARAISVRKHRLSLLFELEKRMFSSSLSSIRD